MANEKFIQLLVNHQNKLDSRILSKMMKKEHSEITTYIQDFYETLHALRKVEQKFELGAQERILYYMLHKEHVLFLLEKCGFSHVKPQFDESFQIVQQKLLEIDQAKRAKNTFSTIDFIIEFHKYSSMIKENHEKKEEYIQTQRKLVETCPHILIKEYYEVIYISEEV